MLKPVSVFTITIILHLYGAVFCNCYTSPNLSSPTSTPLLPRNLAFPSSTPSSTLLSATPTSPTQNALPYPVRIAVLGGGNFGLALASVCGRSGYSTTLLVRDPDVAEYVNKNNCHPRYMSDVRLGDKVRATSDAKSALKVRESEESENVS